MTTTESYACSRYRTTALKQVFIFALSILILALITMGCESKTINGQVVDNFGTPLAGVSVQVENSAFSTTTNPQGHYELNYAPGSFNVVFSFRGILSKDNRLNYLRKYVCHWKKSFLRGFPRRTIQDISLFRPSMVILVLLTISYPIRFASLFYMERKYFYLLERKMALIAVFIKCIEIS